MDYFKTLFIDLDYWMLLFVSICGLAFYLFNELEDESIKNTWKKHKRFLNSNESWKRKWADGSTTKERFWGSSRWFVFMTDGEHLFQFIKFRFIEIALLLISWEYALVWIIGKLIMSTIKELFLKKIN